MHSCKSCSGKSCFCLKVFFGSNFLKKISFDSFFVQRVKFWIKTFQRVRLRAFFLQFGNFGTKNFRKCWISKKKLTTDQVFKWNWFVKKQILKKVLLSENHSWFISPRENANFCSYAFSQKPTIAEKNGRKNSFPNKAFEKSQILNKLLYNESDFESTKTFTSCQVLNWFST